MRKKSLVAGLILLGLAIILIVLPRVLRTSMIVGIGVIMTDVLTLMFIAPLIIAVLVLAFSVYPFLKQGMSQKAEKKQRKVNLSYKSDTLEPNDVRDRLQKLITRHPSLNSLFDQCLKQMDSIDHRQAGLAEMIELNGAEFLSDAPSALDEAEQLIMRNLMWVINRGIVAITDGDLNTGDDREFGELIKKVLKGNEQVLAKCQDMLSEASDLISDKGSKGSTMSIEAWTTAIRQQVQSSNFFKEE